MRAIYNHARKTNKKLPSDNPADAVDWNEEKRRDTGMGAGDLKGWFSELALLENPERRDVSAGECLDQGLGEPFLIFVGRPTVLEHEHAIDIASSIHPHDVADLG